MKFSHKLADNEKGFTLIEVLISTAIIGIITITLTTLMNQVNQAMIQMENQFAQSGEKKVGFASFETSLRRTHAPELSSDGWHFMGDDHGSDFEFGTLDDINLDCEAEDSHGMRKYFSHPEHREGNPDMVSDRRVRTINLESPAQVQLCALLLDQQSHENSANNYPSLLSYGAGGAAHVNNVDRLSFRYYDEGRDSWYTSWPEEDDHNESLPDAVEYAYRVVPPGGDFDPSWFRGIVNLRASRQSN